jgi:hypothetical protein
MSSGFSPAKNIGTAPRQAMTHIVIQEAQNGKVVDWMEHVSDEQYGK